MYHYFIYKYLLFSFLMIMAFDWKFFVVLNLNYSYFFSSFSKFVFFLDILQLLLGNIYTPKLLINIKLVHLLALNISYLLCY